MYRSLAVALTCGGILCGNPIVDVPVGMQWAREFNNYIYEWHAANDRAGEIPVEPTQALLFVSMLRVDSPVQPDPWQTAQYQPGVQMEVALQRADGTASYNFIEPGNRPFAGTTTLAPEIGEMLNDGVPVPLSDIEAVPLDPDQITTFLAPGVNFYLYVKPLTTDVQIREVDLNVSAWNPELQTGLIVGATPLGGWQVVSADDPLGDPPAVPEPATVLTVPLLGLAVLTWRARYHRPQAGRSRSTAPVPISR